MSEASLNSAMTSVTISLHVPVAVVVVVAVVVDVVAVVVAAVAVVAQITCMALQCLLRQDNVRYTGAWGCLAIPGFAGRQRLGGSQGQPQGTSCFHSRLGSIEAPTASGVCFTMLMYLEYKRQLARFCPTTYTVVLMHISDSAYSACLPQYILTKWSIMRCHTERFHFHLLPCSVTL